VPQAKQAGENRKLRNEVVRLQREMVGVSAQDNFAKWARLRRDHDKAKDKYEKAGMYGKGNIDRRLLEIGRH
jgi:hypothetical protein